MYLECPLLKRFLPLFPYLECPLLRGFFFIWSALIKRFLPLGPLFGVSYIRLRPLFGVSYIQRFLLLCVLPLSVPLYMEVVSGT